MAWLSNKLQINCGNKWGAVIDDDEVYVLAMEEWRNKLAGMTKEDLQVGVDKITESWWPNPAGFKDMCYKPPAVQHLGYDKRKEFERGHSDSERREARRGIRAIRVILNK